MAHQAQRDFVEIVSRAIPEFFVDSRVLEIGSLNINGSVRDFFAGCEYIGIDVADGPCVDVVCEGQKYDAPDESFDQVISCEAMEHNPFWIDTFKNMIRLCRPGGLVVMTCATAGRCEHGTRRTTPGASPLTVELGWDYYRNLNKRDFEKIIDLKMCFNVYNFWVNWSSYDLYFCGLKKGHNNTNWSSVREKVTSYVSEANNRKIMRYRAIVGTAFGDSWFVIARKIAWYLNYVH